MKYLVVLLSQFVLVTSTYAQSTLSIKEGNRLTFQVSVNGRSFPVFIQVDSLNKNNCALTWSMEDGRSGKFIMNQPSLDSGRFGYWNPPVNGEELILPSTQNILFISRYLFTTLKNNQHAVFDEYTLTVKPSPFDSVFKLNDKNIDVLYMESEAGTKLWVLNDPAKPLIVKMEGNPFGVDVELLEIQ